MSDSWQLLGGDLDLDTAAELEIRGKEHGLAVDTETTGLDARSSTIQVVSLAVPGKSVVLTIEGGLRPQALASLLENNSIPKIFHNALFDVTFIKAQWKYLVEPIFCTKVAARLAGVSRNPTLQCLTEQLLGVSMDKSTRMSDWTTRPLSEAQAAYASEDVVHLHDLQRVLSWMLADAGQTSLFERCMAFINSRAELDLEQLGDVFTYALPDSHPSS
jgi:ribonuclease D